MVYIYTVEYYSAVKRNEILTYATTWMNLENIWLSEISYKVSRVGKFIETRK